jgi:hypothetical protein
MATLQIKTTSEDPIISQICQKYWSWSIEDDDFKGTVQSIASQHGLSTARDVNKIVTEWCQAFSPDILCSQCGKPFVFSSRSDYKQSRYLKNWICNECQGVVRHQELQRRAALEQERKESLAQLRERQKQIIQRQYSLENRPAINVNSIDLKDAVYLLSVTRAATSEDLSIIYPIETIKGKIAPTEEMLYNILRHLYRKQLLLVHPSSDPNAFEFDGETETTIYLGTVVWTIPYGVAEASTKSLIEEIEKTFRDMDWPENWHDEQLDLWKEIGLNETLEYLALCLAEHKLPFKAGEKTLTVLNQVLDDYSVAQIHNFIWRAAKDAAAFQARNNSTATHAANTVVGAIQRAAETAKASGWDVKPYRRSFSCPQSMLSQVFFNAVLQIGDDGFSKKAFAI